MTIVRNDAAALERYQGDEIIDNTPIHPGEILMEEFLKPIGLTPNRLAMDLHVPAPRIYAILSGKRAITADTALRLGKYFGTTATFWMGLQGSYDLAIESTRIDLGEVRELRRA